MADHDRESVTRSFTFYAMLHQLVLSLQSNDSIGPLFFIFFVPNLFTSSQLSNTFVLSPSTSLQNKLMILMNSSEIVTQTSQQPSTTSITSVDSTPTRVFSNPSMTRRSPLLTLQSSPWPYNTLTRPSSSLAQLVPVATT